MANTAMLIPPAHDWDITPGEAVALQNAMKDQVVLQDDFGDIRHIAGIDVGFNKKNHFGRAAVVILEMPDLNVVEKVTEEAELCFPYVPGLLSFREIPLILSALSKTRITPDLFLCDGQGTAHPRRFGIACHLGVLTGIPSIGAAKSRLVGSHGTVPKEKGGWAPLIHQGDVVGAVLRTRERVKPIYVSPGHKVSLESSIRLVMACITRYKLPETTREAHKLSLFSRPQ